MVRRIVDHTKLTDEILTLLVEKFPEGIDDDAIQSIPNAKGKFTHVVEVKNEESIFLVKVSDEMEAQLDEFRA